ncbi:hypothetical protein PR202_gb12609 [Eleusine coracana subsp. coracana]|uniref:Exocyst component Exo84 C-terminal domain-containing protein n=1 Tax=Eleusine coracana subsp. coracana TaxID=191504 RepID=A0AAV5ERX4_ELECO|nr:hypothetical protein PR202_gb12609 [Eleusine coracana subsp. coracana]
MRRSVYANYAAFIRTSKEISDLEGELLSIRNLLNTQAALIHGLSEGVQIDSLTSGPEGSVEDDISNVEDQEPSEIQKWAADFPDMLDVLLAERRVDEALDALDEAERVALDTKRQQTLTSAEILALRRSVSDNRQRLADQLAEAACQSSTRGIELRAAASALKRLGDGPRAHSLLLNAHNQRLQCNMQTIHPSSTSYGGAYTAALAQQVFSVVAQALSDSVEVFGDESCYASELVTWATKQDFFEDVAPLLTLQLGGSTMDGITQIFNSYVNLLISALPGSMDDEANLDGLGHKIVRMAETEEQQLALLANASLLAEELLPRAAMKLSSINQSNMDDLRKRGTDKQNRMPEQREWKRKLQRMELYAKLNRMAGIAAEMFVGRERFATLLMMRLTETVIILWLSEDQAFWEEIEQGPKPLGPIGLQQFYLDMQFVIIFGQGRFLSRHVHQVILDIIDRAMAAFSATGINPDSVLPGDNWFMDVAHDVVSMISGKGRAANGDREINSPTASVSAHSISSFRSHGSS